MKKKGGKSPLRLLAALFSSLIAGALILAIAAAAVALYCNAPPKDIGILTVNQRQDPAGLRGVEFEYGSEGGPAKSALITISEGESSYAAGNRLERAGLIKTRYFWNLLSRFDGQFLKAGTYRVELPASQTALRNALVNGQQVLISVTIPEGVTLKKAAAILDAAGICGKEAFIAAASSKALVDRYRIPDLTLEGYLYPDTYFLPGAFPADQAVITMADTFFAKIAQIAPESASMSPADLNRLVIIASVVEREYRVSEEAPVMAGVFFNRIQRGMKLESCATVEYVMTDILGRPHPKVLYYEDLEIDNPYNTYLYRGLPPGPISLPGATALDAAFHPAKTDYLYFRLIDEAAGKHYFSRTFDDHIKAGRLFVKGN